MIGVIAAVCIVAVLAGQAALVTRLRRDEAPVPHQPVATAPALVPATGLVGVLRRHPWLRRGLSFGSVATMLVAVGVIGYPFYTNLYASRVQSRLERQLASDELRQDYQACSDFGLGDDRCRIADGDSLTRIQIPKIDVDVVVVEGVSGSALRAGAGHYPSTPLPCEAGNVGIAGHRTTYGRPFHNLDLLTPGDEIVLQTPIGSCTYRVTGSRIVVPSDTSVIQNTRDDDVLTLTTCNPKGSARQRLVVRAELVTPLSTA